MTTRHKLVAFLPIGDPDRGEEIETEIAFTFLPGGKPSFDDPGFGPEIEFLSAAPLCNGKPAPFFYNSAMQRDIQNASLDDLARDWLESDVGRAAALEEVAAELQEARVFIAALRKDA